MALMFAVFMVVPALAQIGAIEAHLKAAAEEGAGYAAPQDPRYTVAVIIRTALGIIGTVFLILTIYAGAIWMTSGGNEEQVGKAKRIITASVIGLAIVLLSYGITRFVSYIVTGGKQPGVQTIKTQPPQEQFIPFGK